MSPKLSPILSLRMTAVSLLLFSLLGLLAIPSVAQQAVAKDQICVSGTVINHEEQPINGWNITATPNAGGNAITVAVDDQGRFRFDGLTDGVWKFSIDSKPEWSPVTPASFEVALGYGQTECTRIRFKMRQLVEIRVWKIDDDHTPLEGWIIRAVPGPGNRFATPQERTTGPDGIAVFLLTPGMWHFSEHAPAGVRYTPVWPADGEQDLYVAGPGPHMIRFKNRVVNTPGGCIEATKVDTPPVKSGQSSYGLRDWKIVLKRWDGSVFAEQLTDVSGYTRFDNVPLGPYMIYEELIDGWIPVSPTAYNITLTEAGKCVKVDFVNKQITPDYCIEGYVIDVNGGVGLPGWVVRANPSVPSNVTPNASSTNGTGHFHIGFPHNDYRVPGAEYKVCVDGQAGWLPVGDSCQMATLPKDPTACVELGFRFTQRQEGHDRVTPPPTTDTKPGSSDACRLHHTVGYGQSIYGLADHYGVSRSAMLHANSWVKSRYKMYLRVGDTVCVPN